MTTRIDLGLRVADLAALVALDDLSVPPRVDGGIYFVDAAGGAIIQGRWAQYRAGSAAAVSNDVLLPEDEVGRWHLAIAQGAAGNTVDMLIVQAASDLTEFLTGDEYILPDKVVMIDGTVDLVDKAVRLSTGTVLRGLAKGTLISTNSSGVVRATNVASAVLIREVNIVCTTGPCLVLTGTTEHQLNLFFVGMFGAKAATITGFDVQSFKQCFISCAEGITLTGTTNKIFISDSPFYSITGSAMTFAAALNASVADIVSSFFKFDSPGVGITAEAGYTVGEGKVRGSLIDGTAIPLSGLAPSDLNWFMTDNSGIRDSRYGGGLYLTAEAETVITTINTPVKVAGTTAGLSMNERFTATTNRLTYNGSPPALVAVTGTYSVATGNNVALSFYVAKNGVVVEESRTMVRVGTGNDERAGAIATLVEMVNGDYIELWVENNDGTANLTCRTLTLNGKS